MMRRFSVQLHRSVMINTYVAGQVMPISTRSLLFVRPEAADAFNAALDFVQAEDIESVSDLGKHSGVYRD